MSKWFHSLPDAIHGLELASKVQYETMARLIRSYKTKCASQKELIERLRKEVDTLKVRLKSHRILPSDNTFKLRQARQDKTGSS